MKSLQEYEVTVSDDSDEIGIRCLAGNEDEAIAIIKTLLGADLHYEVAIPMNRLIKKRSRK